MGKLTLKSYKVKRDGVWVTVNPEPVEMGVNKTDRKAYNNETNRKRLLNEKRRKNQEYGF